MIVNLYVDHLMKTSPASAEEFWNATREHPQVFAMAARSVGLTDPEYAEFRQDLLAGKAIFVKLPKHLDAMSGQRRGYVYAVKQAVVPSSAGALGWEVTLRDGAQVYIPQICGNISLLRPQPATAVAYHAPKHKSRVSPVVYHPVSVDVAAPAAPVGTAIAPIAVAPVVAYVPPVATAASAISPLYAIPVIGGIIVGLTHGGSDHPNLPPCANGSNATLGCTK